MSDCDCNRCNPGEPDTADLVGEINDRCDRVGVPEGTPGERVEWLASRLEMVRAQRDHEVARALWYVAERDRLRADLDAERAQLAAASKPSAAATQLAAAVMLDHHPETACYKLAANVMREALA